LDLHFKKSIREVEEKIKLQEEEFNKMINLRKLEQQELLKYSQTCDKLEQDISLADEKHDAALIIAQFNENLNHRDSIKHRIDNIDRDILQILDTVENLRLQYEQLTIKAKNYFLNPTSKLTEITESLIMHQKMPETL
jgi:hypothetical protein